MFKYFIELKEGKNGSFHKSNGYDVKNVTVRLSANSYEKGVGTLWKYSWQLEEWGDCRRYYYGENVEVVKGSNSPIVRSLILI